MIQHDSRTLESVQEHICFHCGIKKPSRYLVDDHSILLDVPTGWFVGPVYDGNDSQRCVMVTSMCQECAKDRIMRTQL